MSDNRPAIPRPPQSVARERASEWFLGNFHRGAVMRLVTNTASHVQLDIEPGKVGDPVRHAAGVFNLRKASIIRNDQELQGIEYVGLEYHTAQLGYFDRNKRLITTSSSIARVKDIESVSPVTRV